MEKYLMHITTWKELIWKRLIPVRWHSGLYNILEKAKLWRLVGRGKESWIGKSIEEFYGNETILYETTIEDTCRCTVVKTDRMDNIESES